MPTSSPAAGLPVAVITRDGRWESVHRGMASVVDSTGRVLVEVGEATTPVFPRSTLKPLQTLAVLELGTPLDELEIALATASHSGSARHREAVAAFLLHHQASSALLQCPADWPLSSEEKVQMLRDGAPGPSRLAMNCSGKHASFLAACQHLGWDLDSYLEGDHPLQSHIARTIEEWTGETITHTSPDGCGAPLHQISLRGLARGIAKLSSGSTPSAEKIITAVGRHPWAIAGDGHPNTVTIETLGGIAKIGAEGLVVIGLPSGIAVAVKILDGSMRATTPVALWLLESVGAITSDQRDRLLEHIAEKTYGAGQIVGGLQVIL